MPTGPAVRHCPFDFADALEFDPALRQLMADGPVTRIRLRYGQDDAWLVTRYDDVRTVTTDRRFSRHAVIGRDFPRMTPEPIVQDEAINLMDPPASNRLRSLVSKAFARDLLEHARTRTRLATDSLLDAMAAHGPGADLVEHLAGPLPLTVICDVLDIPEGDRATLRGHARTMMDTTPEGKAAAVQAKAELRAYFATLTAQRRRDPGPDLISALAAARDGDQMLDPHELTVMAMVLLITGQDTTTYQIANLAYALLTRPAELALLRDRPDQLAPVVNELLRLIPFRKGVGIPRIATEDVQLGGVTIKAGDTVHVSYLTANRDPSTFHYPDELDLERTGPAHMTFGWGAHHCLGAPLADIELHTALDALLSRFPGLALARPAHEIRWDTASIWRHPLALPVTW